MGTIVLGKVESGVVTRGQQLMIMPNKVLVEVMQLWSDEEETELANPGENVKLKLKNVEEEASPFPVFSVIKKIYTDSKK